MVGELWTTHSAALLDMLGRLYFWAETADNGLQWGGLDSK